MGEVFEEGEGFLDAHGEDVGDGLAAVFDFEGFAVVAGAFAGFAGDEDIGEEVHFDAFGALSLAGFAAAALDVEGEASGFVAAHFGFAGAGVEGADEVEDAGVGGGIGARGAADGGLVDFDDFVERRRRRGVWCGRRVVPWSRRVCV